MIDCMTENEEKTYLNMNRRMVKVSMHLTSAVKVLTIHNLSFHEMDFVGVWGP